MSSILDALKKLEEEKAREKAAAVEPPLDEELAAAELTGRGRVRSTRFFRLDANIAVPLVLSVSLLLAVSSVAVVYFVFRAQQLHSPVSLETMTASTSIQPSAAPFMPIPAAEMPAHSAASTGDKNQDNVLGSPPESVSLGTMSVADTSKNTSLRGSPRAHDGVPWEPLKREEREEIVYVKADPPPAKLPTRQQEQTVVPQRPDPPVSKETISDPTVLPILTPSEQARLGLPRLRVNFVSRNSSRSPQPYALINYNKVYVGEMIPETNAMLIGVSVQGVGIDVGGQKYFVPAR